MQAHDGARDRGLAASGFAYQCHDFALMEGEIDAVDSARDKPVPAVADREVDVQVGDLGDGAPNACVGHRAVSNGAACSADTR